jgi:hypothetical protein
MKMATSTIAYCIRRKCLHLSSNASIETASGQKLSGQYKSSRWRSFAVVSEEEPHMVKI